MKCLLSFIAAAVAGLLWAIFNADDSLDRGL